MSEEINKNEQRASDLDNSITLKSLAELFGMNFFIPSYQRGYRWTEQQVKELLNDIKEFSESNLTEGQFYCMQPLVVREMDESAKQKFGLTGSWYEVIDGQQRLTTLLVLLRLWSPKFRELYGDINEYHIKYERRLCNDQDDFLINLSDLTQDNAKDIDDYHLCLAKDAINKWNPIFPKGKGKFIEALITHGEKTLENGEKIDPANNLRFIWYELGENEDPIKVFTRLNVGKISLTNAELIKALLLKSSNFKGESNVTKLRQQEIAAEWDNIEYTLQNDEFWLFLHEAGYDHPTRIDFIFDLICKHNVLEIPQERYDEIGSDEYRTFRYFYEYFTHTANPSVKDCWETVTHRFSTFAEWYDESELYHYIGYLIECKERSLEELMKVWSDSDSKTSFIQYLKKEIEKVVTRYPLDYQFKEDGSDKRKAKPTLLFHNIQTVIDQNKAQKDNLKYGLATFYKFPFHLYKLEGWDVEHISSNTTNSEGDIETQKEWLLNCYLGVEKDIQEEIRSYFDLPSEKDMTEKFKELKSKINTEAEDTELSPKEKNRIWNYALLDSSSNRSYGNSIFSAKRRILIGKQQGKKIGVPRFTRDKKIDVPDVGKSDSAFVPPCTMNVFLKYFSMTSSSVNYWTIPDCTAYQEDIQRCIDELSEAKTKKN